MTPLGEQVLDAVTAFLKLFCKSARMHERRSLKTGKSTAYYQVSVRVRLHALMPAHRVALQIYGYAEFYVRTSCDGVHMNPRQSVSSGAYAEARRRFHWLIGATGMPRPAALS